MNDTENVVGTRMTCSNPDCDCQLEIIQPCPHGSGYTCGCGHPFDATGE